VVWGVFVGCMVPPQSGSQPTSPPPGYGAPPNAPPGYAAAPSSAGQASCQQDLQCYGARNAEPCLAACDAQGTPDASAGSRAVLQCAIRNNCSDSDCVSRACGAEMARCNTVQPTIASQQPGPPPAQSPPP